MRLLSFYYIAIWGFALTLILVGLMLVIEDVLMYSEILSD